MARGLGLVMMWVAVGALAACGERSQDLHSAGKDQPAAWKGTDNGFSAAGWKAGDAQAWDLQLNRRAQGQNEYTRIGGKS
ncbi:MAG: hypothetical protein ABIX12_13185 [Rubrivivax sp.]